MKLYMSIELQIETINKLKSTLYRLGITPNYIKVLSVHCGKWVITKV